MGGERDQGSRASARGSVRLVDEVVGQVQDYAIIALDPQGVIETWNLGAERVKGYTPEEAIGRSFSMFYPRRTGAPACHSPCC